MSQLPKTVTGVVPQANNVGGGFSDAICKVMDPVSAVPRIPSSGQFVRRSLTSAPVLIQRLFPVLGCVVHEQGLSNLLHEEKGTERRGGFERHVG